MGSRVDPPRVLVEHYEESLDGELRQARGAHYTPTHLARLLVEIALDEFEATHGMLPSSLCDPSCGAGSILLVMAEVLNERGLAPTEVLQRVTGGDLDVTSVGVAREVLAGWGRNHGLSDPRVSVEVLDALGDRSDDTPFDVVVGNPPFASPLTSGVAARRAARSGGGSVGRVGSPPQVGSPYTDDAARHLLAGTRMLADGGILCMLSPQSLLGARDTGWVRAELLEACELTALWLSDEQFFEHASVHVCAPVLRRGGGPGATPQVELIWRDRKVGRASVPTGGSWAPLMSAAMGTPSLATPRISGDTAARVPLEELARCTAGFRDEFYALAACASERVETRTPPPAPDNEPPGALSSALSAVPTEPAPGQGEGRLVTSGLIDPGVNRWGQRMCRISGRRFSEPVVDLGRLARESSRVARWCSARSVPKVLVATQTRVVEACVDHRGDLLPLTPVVSVEPMDGVDPAAIAAVLSAPSVSLAIATGAAGTGLSSSAVRVSASALRNLMVPVGGDVLDRAVSLWSEFEGLAASGTDATTWREIGGELDALTGSAAPEVIQWWVQRLPKGLFASE
ncbi:MAG: N-6 DNA methylase [Microthrixaceae bacterium]